MRKLNPLYLLPGVVGIYYVVHSLYFARGLDNTDLTEIFLNSLLILLFACVVTFVIGRKGAPDKLLMATLIVILALFYGYFRDQLFAHPAVGIFVRNHFWNKNNTFFILLLVVVSGSIIAYIRSNADKSLVIGKFLIVFFIALMCMDIATFYRTQPKVILRPSGVPVNLHLSGDKPDVYFMIFDSETSSKSLTRYWNYNNDSVENALREKGFFIESRGRSNYNWTPYSIGSTLNMSYLTDFSTESFTEEFPREISSDVMKIFENNGYAVHNLSFFKMNEHPRIGSIVEFTMWEKTVFYFLYDRFANYTFTAYRSMHKELMRTTSDSLLSIVQDQNTAPKFVYAHFYIPHPPAFLDENGNDVNPGTMDAQDMIGYLKQVVYANKMMLQLVGKIQGASHGKAIILIQGDHGYRFLEGPQKMNEQFDIFKAVYFPDKNYTLFNDSVSSVNTFRLALNTEFGTNLPLMKDSSINVLTEMLKRFR